MSYLQSTCHIEAPVERVFDDFLHPTKLADHMPPVQIRELKETDEGTGTSSSYRTRVAGIPFDSSSVYAGVVPNSTSPRIRRARSWARGTTTSSRRATARS